MRIYATVDDLAAWTSSETPSNAAALLRSASLLVESSTRHAVYATDSAGLPLDQTVIAAFRDATAAQAAFWADLGVNPSLGAAGLATPAASSKSVNGVSITYATDKDAAAAKVSAATTLAPDAYTLLRAAGLITNAVRSY